MKNKRKNSPKITRNVFILPLIIIAMILLSTWRGAAKEHTIFSNNDNEKISFHQTDTSRNYIIIVEIEIVKKKDNTPEKSFEEFHKFMVEHGFGFADLDDVKDKDSTKTNIEKPDCEKGKYLKIIKLKVFDKNGKEVKNTDFVLSLYNDIFHFNNMEYYFFPNANIDSIAHSQIDKIAIDFIEAKEKYFRNDNLIFEKEGTPPISQRQDFNFDE